MVGHPTTTLPVQRYRLSDGAGIDAYSTGVIPLFPALDLAPFVAERGESVSPVCRAGTAVANAFHAR